MHPHCRASVVRVLTFDCPVNQPVLAQHVSQVLDVVKLGNFGGTKPCARAHRTAELTENVKEVAIPACPCNLQMKLNVVRQHVGAPPFEFGLETVQRATHLLEILLGTPACCQSGRRCLDVDTELDNGHHIEHVGEVGRG